MRNPLTTAYRADAIGRSDTSHPSHPHSLRCSSRPPLLAFLPVCLPHSRFRGFVLTVLSAGKAFSPDAFRAYSFTPFKSLHKYCLTGDLSHLKWSLAVSQPVLFFSIDFLPPDINSLLVYYLSLPLEYQHHESKDFVLLTAEPLAPRTVPGVR